MDSIKELLDNFTFPDDIDALTKDECIELLKVAIAALLSAHDHAMEEAFGFFSEEDN